METSELKPNMKRTRKNYEGPKNKRQRVDSSDEPADKTTKIVDLNDDCLVKILEHLDLQSLFNVAIASEWLRLAAGDVYKRELGTTPIEIGDRNMVETFIMIIVHWEFVVKTDLKLRVLESTA